jgi:hypothetical protein
MMAERTLAAYIQSRLDSGEAFSDIKAVLLRAGYSESQIDDAYNEASGQPDQLVLEVSPKALPKPEKRLSPRRLAWVSYGLGTLVLAVLVMVAATHLDFSGVDWKVELSIGGIYFAGILVLMLIQCFFIYSIHQASITHSVSELFFTKILTALLAGHIFTFVLLLLMPGIIWLPVIIGNIIFVLLLFLSTNSSPNEITASTIIFFMLTYLFYLLISKVYTREALMGLLGIG